MELKHKFFPSLDFDAIASFGEVDVSAVIVDPLLKKLGWKKDQVIRDKSIKTKEWLGTKKQEVFLFPDYLLCLSQKYACVIEVKSPEDDILKENNVRQCYSFASHVEVRSVYFALCNGLQFALFRTGEPSNPILHFKISEIDKYWDALCVKISPLSFQTDRMPQYEKPENQQDKFDYASRPLLKEIIVKKQQARRYFGCNAYFARQPWDVVSAYIKNYSAEGDVVLDPFGGSGITAMEALINRRNALHVDINPLSIFMTNALLSTVNPDELQETFNDIKSEYLQNEPKTEIEIKEALEKYPLPADLPLPKDSDVATLLQLFSKEQLAQLAYLKSLIIKIEDKNMRLPLMLAFYNTLTICNLTFHETPSRKGLGGHHFGFYYRYRMARFPTALPVMEVFEKKLTHIYNGKIETNLHAEQNKTNLEEMITNAKIIKGSATELSFIENESVDYIYADPPYGKNIQYLDLCLMWNAWLDFEVTESDYGEEAIEGGSRAKSKDEYKSLIAKSIEEMYRVLKFDRTLSFVFAHKNPEFWYLIVETCEKCGFEYIGSVPQNNWQTSFKKKQHPFTALSGQLIVNFRKVKNPRSVLKANLEMDLGYLVMQTIEGIIAKEDGATIEQINEELITRSLELGFLKLLKKEYDDLTPLLREHFYYNAATEKYDIRENTSFTTHIDVKLRVKYYVTSYLINMERQSINALFEDIISNVMPLFDNGAPPEEKTILSILENIAVCEENGGWHLKQKESELPF